MWVTPSVLTSRQLTPTLMKPPNMLTSSQLTPTPTEYPLVDSHHHSSLLPLHESPNFFRRCSLVHPPWSLWGFLHNCHWYVDGFLQPWTFNSFFFKLFFPLSRENSWYYFLICSQKIVIKQIWASHEWYSWAHVCISLGAVFCVFGILLLRTGVPISLRHIVEVRGEAEIPGD